MPTLEIDATDPSFYPAYDDLTPEEQKQAFAIDSDSAADWYLARLAALESEIALIRSQAELLVKRLTSDREGLERRFGPELEAYMRGRIGSDRRGRKSLHLLHGTCLFRTVPANLSVKDKQAAMDFAVVTGHGDLIITRQELDAAGYRKLALARLEETGEILPGVERSEARETFSVKFGAKGTQDNGNE